MTVEEKIVALLEYGSKEERTRFLQWVSDTFSREMANAMDRVYPRIPGD